MYFVKGENVILRNEDEIQNYFDTQVRGSYYPHENDEYFGQYLQESYSLLEIFNFTQEQREKIIDTYMDECYGEWFDDCVCKAEFFYENDEEEEE